MKRIISIIIAACFILAGAVALSSCEKKKTDEKISIVTTIFPEYDWAMTVLGEKKSEAKVTFLLDSGVDLHSYQPTVKDVAEISTCDLFIYVGGESDKWVDEALEKAVNKNMKVINLLELLGENAKEEEHVDGMEEHEHEHEDEDHDHDHEEEEIEYDEHVWLSLKNAPIFVSAIAEALAKIDPDDAALYKSNADEYNKKLASLDGQYEAAVKGAAKDTLLFGDRFPFRYLVDDYGLNYFAAFSGCAAETEASFETVIFLANKIDELGLGVIIRLESSKSKIPETIKNNTSKKDQKILTMNSAQSATLADYAKGVTYLSIMEENLSVLKEALK